MKTTTSTHLPNWTGGIDLGDKKHALCVIDAAGGIIEQRTITVHRVPAPFRLAKETRI